MMRVAVPAGMACADYRESTVLSRSHIFCLRSDGYCKSKIKDLYVALQARSKSCLL